MPSIARAAHRLGRIPELARVSRHTTHPVGLILHYLGARSQYPLAVPLRGGGHLTLSSRAEVMVFWQIFVRSCYRVPDDCTTILDAGANVGIFAAWAARRLPRARILSLEPSPETFGALERNLVSAGVASRVRPVQCGLAAVPGKRLLDARGPSPNRKMILTSPPSSGVVEIDCVTLTDALQSCGDATIDFLKLDIEGGEWEVILTTPPPSLARVRHIQVEYHEVNAALGYSVEALFAHIESSGHRLTYREEDELRTGLAVFAREAGPG